jgi:uncharacterized membrane protein
VKFRANEVNEMKWTGRIDVISEIKGLSLLYGISFILFLLVGQWDVFTGSKTLVEVFWISVVLSFVVIAIVVIGLFMDSRDKRNSMAKVSANEGE